MSNYTKISIILSLASFIMTTLMFLPARNAGMVHDFTGFFINMSSASYMEALHSFDYNVVQPFLQTFNITLFRLAGRNSLIYFITFHLLLSLGIFAWAKYLIEVTKSHALTVAIVLVFICNPYIVEVLVYDVCQAYLWSFIFLGFYHLYLFKFLTGGGQKHLWLLGLILMLQLWTFDFILIYLPLTLLFLWTLEKPVKIDRWKPIFIVNFVVLALYFIQNKLFLNSWIGHYGTEVHMALDLQAQLGTMVKYFVKHIGLGQFWSYPNRHAVYTTMQEWWVLIFFISLSIFVLYTFVFRRSKFLFLRMAQYFFLASLIALIPISNLTFLDLMLTVNDRYGFLFGFFIVSAIISLVFLIKNKFIRAFVFTSFVVLQLMPQRKLIQTWSNGQQIVNEALKNWPAEFYQPENNIYLLNLPDNYHGTYLFKNLGSDSKVFEETYLSQISDTSFANFVVVAQMNMDQITDGANAEWRSHEELKVGLNQYGTWWWRNGLGAGSYQTDDYDFKLNNLEYLLIPKNPEARYYIWDQLNWKSVNK